MAFGRLCIGQLPEGRGWVVSSETCGLDIVGAEYVRDVEPGEMVRFTAEGMVSEQAVPPRPRAACIFEYVYFARPDSVLDGQSVYQARRAMGRILADEAPVEADLVLGVPDSGVPAALGYSEASGIPFTDGIVKNRYVGRTFIQPTQAMRQLGIRLKLNPLPSVISGKRLVVIDDSIVRGNTSKKLVQMLRDAGAAEVHLRIVSPEVLWPCFYGIDTDTREQLIAANMTLEEMNDWIGSDSLAFITSGRPARLARRCGPRRLLHGLLHRRLPGAHSRRCGKEELSYPQGLRGGVRRRGFIDTERNPMENQNSVTYAEAGVDIVEGARAVDAIKDTVHSTYRPEVVGDIGGFGGLFSIAAAKDMADPLLVSGTDGVGTKLKVAQLPRRARYGGHRSGGHVRERYSCHRRGAFVLPRLRGRGQAGCRGHGQDRRRHRRGLPPVRLRAHRRRDGRASRRDGPDDYDLSGFCVGLVDRPRMLDPESVREGDVLIGLASSGLHSNGYSLARKVCIEGRTEEELREAREDLGGQSMLEALLTPTRIYVKPVRAVMQQVPWRHPRSGSYHWRRHHREPEPRLARRRERRGRFGHLAHSVGGALCLRAGESFGGGGAEDLQHGSRYGADC